MGTQDLRHDPATGPMAWSGGSVAEITSPGERHLHPPLIAHTSADLTTILYIAAFLTIRYLERLRRAG
jgi:hypothetical protein